MVSSNRELLLVEGGKSSTHVLKMKGGGKGRHVCCGKS